MEPIYTLQVISSYQEVNLFANSDFKQTSYEQFIEMFFFIYLLKFGSRFGFTNGSRQMCFV